ncbi:MAG: hypothetical protein U0L71_01220 [Eggerthellaceae bacterium]|nr:hypothetical protein [Eggerthellaceae bacterium]
MLPYFRNYAFVGYVLGMAVPVLLVTAISWVTGFYIVYTLPGLIAAILLLIIGLLTAKKIVTGLADKKAAVMISLYNDGCDPQAFVDASQKVVREIRPPYDESGSWFLSFYALALDDLGRRDEAARIGQTMLSSAQMAQDPQVKAGLLVNIEPLVQRLFGAEQALEVVQNAQMALAGAADADSQSRLSFLKWEQGILEAILDGDGETLITRFSGIRTSLNYPLRIRVSYAILEASLHKARGESDRERECLEFVMQNGGKLPAVQLASRRLQELGR